MKEVTVGNLETSRAPVLFVLLMLALPLIPGPVQGADGGPKWRAEFNDVCGRTADAEEMTTETLMSMLGRCERLQPQIEQLEESERKVMRRRLKMCCDLYKFMVETRNTAKP